MRDHQEDLPQPTGALHAELKRLLERYIVLNSLQYFQ